MESADVLYVVRSFVDRKVEHEWSTWHMNSHVPEVLKQPGFLKATRFRRPDSKDDIPEYWTIYEMKSMKDFESYNSSEAAKRLRADHDSKFGASARLERFVLIKTFEKLRDE